MFYPIPSLDGKYEIDKKGVVRNSQTKHIIKPRGGKSYYPFSLNNTQIWRCRETLMSEVFDKIDDYLPIPSLGGKYEINQRGILRNAKTKKRLRLNRSADENAFFYSVKINGIYTHRYLQQLMWEVHGVLPKAVAFRTAISVTIQKAGEHFTFDSITKCAKFLSPKEHYSFSWIFSQLQQRRKEIYGWKVFYHEDKRTLKNLDHGIKGRKLKNENH